MAISKFNKQENHSGTKGQHLIAKMMSDVVSVFNKDRISKEDAMTAFRNEFDLPDTQKLSVESGYVYWDGDNWSLSPMETDVTTPVWKVSLKRKTR